MARGLSFPFQIGEAGVPRVATRAALLRHQLELLLFTLPGERLHRPEFGCGVQRLVFAGASAETASAAEHTIRQGVRAELGTLITVDAVRVRSEESTLRIDLLYTVLLTGEERAESFRRPLEGPP
jgi:phage baseplate assembly protein W